jgi:two-component system chemotaxis sensor kinase CheA
MQLDMEQFREAFATEATDLLAGMEQNLLDLEGGFIPDVMRELFGAVHTIKGNAALMGFSAAARLAHAAEELLEKLADGALPMKPEISTLLLQSVDALRQQLGLARNTTAVSGLDAEAIERQLLHAAAGRSSAEEVPRSVMPYSGTDERIGEAPARKEHERVLRVELSRLDRMLDLVGEITVARGQLIAMVEGAISSRQTLLDAHRDIDNLFVDLQELLLKVRMVPIGRAFQPFARSLRDLCVASGKLARLETSGEDVEVDASIVDHIRDPLTHLVRNAVDHGIERPEVRHARGKSPTGTVSLRARRESGYIIIRVTDDGGGLDRDRIRARADELGLLGKVDARDDASLYQLVFEPGFTTAARVTELSGRGIGMDVVKRDIESLRGSVRIETAAGEGTTVSLRLPLSLSILEGFLVNVGPDTYIVPLENVRECIELPDEHKNSGPRGILNLRDHALPFLRLRDHFATGGARPARESVVVIEDASGQAGIAVDELLGHAQSVIKPLGKLFQRVLGISGSAILGNGRIALILDIAALLQQVLRGSSAAAMHASSPPSP